jgi:hypothetical protein
MVWDAYEGTDYGDYSWIPAKDKKYWEMPPAKVGIRATQPKSFCFCRA